MTDQPAPAPTLEAARTRAGVLCAATGDTTTQPGKSVHGVLAALLYAADLTGGGLADVMPWAGLGDLDTPARALAEHRERADALVLTHHAEPAHYADVMRLVHVALITTTEESR